MPEQRHHWPHLRLVSRNGQVLDLTIVGGQGLYRLILADRPGDNERHAILDAEMLYALWSWIGREEEFEKLLPREEEGKPPGG